MIGEQIKLETRDLRDIGNVTEGLAQITIKDPEVKYRIGRMHDYLSSAIKSLGKLREKMITEDFGGVMNRAGTKYEFPTEEKEKAFEQAYDDILSNVETVILPRFKKDDLLDIVDAPAMAISVFKELITDYTEPGERKPDEVFEFSFDKKEAKKEAA